MFPQLPDWLRELDSGMCGADGHNFAQFTADFACEWAMQANELAEMSVHDLTTICTGIAQGAANRLLTYAAADVKRIQKFVKKQACQAQNGVAQYS